MRIETSWTARLGLLLVAACTADRPPGDERGGARASLPVGSAANAGSGAAASGSVPAPTAVDLGPSGSSCASTDLQVSRVTPTVMLLVDGSSSMRTEYGNAPASSSAASGAAGGAGGRAAGVGGSGGSASTAPKPTRWSAIRDALIMPDVGVVPQLESMIKFGLAVFGTQPMCPIPLGIVDPTLNNFQKIRDGLPLEPPGMTTPTGRALDQIVERLADPTISADPNDAASPRIIVLATDGDPNDCELEGPMPNYEPSIQAALKAQARSQRMFVISVGQDAAAAHLQELANIGAGLSQTANPGADVFYPSDPAGLASTLQTLIGSVVLCEVALEGTGVKPGSECRGQVALNGVPLGCNDPNGWILVDETHIRLQGTACDTFKGSDNAMLQARFPCSAIIPD
jgi:hypothetical protein